MPRSKIISDKELITKVSADIIAQEGVSALSIRKIAARMNVSTMTLYNYIENVDDIKKEVVLEGFRELYKKSYQELLKVKENDGKMSISDGCRVLAEVLYDFGAANPSLFELMFCNSEGKFHKDAEITPFHRYFDLLRTRSGGGRSKDYRRTLRMLDFVAVFLLLEHVRGLHVYTKQEYRVYIDEYVTKMFDADPE